MLWVNQQRGCRGWSAKQTLFGRWRGEQKPGNAPGQGGFADALRSGEQPSVMQAIGVKGGEEILLCLVLAKEFKGFTWMRGAWSLICAGQVFLVIGLWRAAHS